MDSSTCVDTMKLRLLIIHIEGSQVIVFHIEDAVKSLMISVILANSADLDEMAHFCIITSTSSPSKYLFMVFKHTKGKLLKCYLLFSKGIILKFYLL